MSKRSTNKGHYFGGFDDSILDKSGPLWQPTKTYNFSTTDSTTERRLNDYNSSPNQLKPYIGIAGTLMPGVIDLFTETPEEKRITATGDDYIEDAQNLANTQFRGSNATLLQMSKNLPVWQDVDIDDFGGETNAGVAGLQGILNGTLAGAMTGNPIIAGVTGFANGLTSFLNADSKNMQKREQINRVNKEGRFAAKRALRNFNTAVATADQVNDRWKMQNFFNTNYKNGGLLETNGASWPTGSDFIENGGTHEANPFGGVQYGMASDGIPNYVEEDEVVIDLPEESSENTNNNNSSKYVLSNRVTAGEEELPLLKLLSKNPEKYIGVSYADIYKDIFKKNGITELVNRKDTKDYLKTLNSRIAQAQETTKLRQQQEQLLQALKNSTPEEQDYIMQQLGIDSQQPMQGEYLQSGYANGGNIYIKPSHRGRLTKLKERTGKTESELYNDGNPAHKKMVVFARNARQWNHDDGGYLFPDGGFFNTKGTQGLQSNKDWVVSKNNYHNPAYFNNIVDANGNYLPGYEDWVNGLTQADYDYLSGLEGFDKNINKDLATLKKRALDKNFENTHAWINSLFRDNENNSNYDRANDPLLKNILHPLDYRFIKNSNIDPDHPIQDVEKPPIDHNTYGSINDYSWIMPAISGANLLGDMLGITNVPDYSNARRIGRAILPPRYIGYNPNGRYVNPQLVDTRYNAAQLSNTGNAGINAAKDISGANRATALANIAAQNYLTQQSIGESLAQSQIQNNKAIQDAVTNNNTVDKANAEGMLNADAANQKAWENYVNRYTTQKTSEATLRETIDNTVAANRSANWNNFLENLNGYFENQRNRDLANLQYGWSGYQYQDADGKIHLQYNTPSEERRAKAYIKKLPKKQQENYIIEEAESK